MNLDLEYIVNEAIYVPASFARLLANQGSYVVICIMLASAWARLRQPCDRCRKSCVIDANHYILATSVARLDASM